MKSLIKNTMISLLAVVVVVALLPVIVRLAIVNPEGLKQLPETIKSRFGI